MVDAKNITEDAILKILETVTDPEVPVLSIIDLGIVRKIETDSNDNLQVFITPTYTGCPAMDVIKTNIRLALLQHGFSNVEIITVLSPAWTTDWMTQAGKQKLKAYGIAPPNIKQQVCTLEAFQKDEAVQCPHCNSYHTHLISRFGSTPCKALYKCDDCLESFDYFKCH
jgi:ring-1,2-phenylacetyl-CoA epoxidase subunit PaaD